ncbi:MAG: DHH family phosphoesterase [Promethearchaeota archaeon]|jgi:nanoRNase/pAp phosphatase (c-di-AMP/oligoRNAs hydrolase)
MLYSRYKDFLSFLKGKKILITTHDLVDIDGFASCFSLKFFLIESLGKPIVSLFFSELSKSTKEFMIQFKKKFPEFEVEFKKEVDISQFDICLILDTSNISQIQFSKSEKIELNIPYIIIDHHYVSDNIKDGNIDSLNLIKDNFSSTAEIILELFEQNGQELTPPYRSLIISAILTDSGFFRYGNNKTIINVGKLLNEEVKIQDIHDLLNRRIDVSERIAKIKGLQRVEIIRIRDYLIGISNVSSYGASVASMLLRSGFDVSLVHTKEKRKNIINCRANKNICLQTGLHLGKILEGISEFCEGSGGGHDGAASLTFNCNLEEILPKIIKKIKQIL